MINRITNRFHRLKCYGFDKHKFIEIHGNLDIQLFYNLKYFECQYCKEVKLLYSDKDTDRYYLYEFREMIINQKRTLDNQRTVLFEKVNYLEYVLNVHTGEVTRFKMGKVDIEHCKKLRETSSLNVYS